MITAWTDYPFEQLHDLPYQTAPVRPCEVLTYDGNKYCLVRVEGHIAEIKSGYLYTQPGRKEDIQTAPIVAREALCKLPRKLLSEAQYALLEAVTTLGPQMLTGRRVRSATDLVADGFLHRVAGSYAITPAGRQRVIDSDENENRSRSDLVPLKELATEILTFLRVAEKDPLVNVVVDGKSILLFPSVGHAGRFIHVRYHHNDKHTRPLTRTTAETYVASLRAGSTALPFDAAR
jgi:hypothetical protein